MEPFFCREEKIYAPRMDSLKEVTQGSSGDLHLCNLDQRLGRCAVSCEGTNPVAEVGAQWAAGFLWHF